MIESKNATITSTMLGKEDHGIFTFVLHLDYGGSGQGAGTYALSYGGYDEKEKFVPYMGELLWRIMDTVGVRTWEDLRGEHIRVKADHCKVHAIGNFLRDKWLDFEEFFNAHMESNEQD